MNCIIYTKVDGTVSVGHINPKILDTYEKITACATSTVAQCPYYAGFRIGDYNELPGGSVDHYDDYFLEAFDDNLVDAVSIDMVKARVVQDKKLGKAIDKQNKKWDDEYNVADYKDDNTKKQEITGKKNDMKNKVKTLPSFDTATSPEELYAIWPEGLPR